VGFACRYDDAHIIDLILDTGYDINQCIYGEWGWGRNPRLIVCTYLSQNIVTKLVERGCDLKPYLLTLCSSYCSKSDEQKRLRIAEILIKSGGININEISGNGYTALHHACSSKSIKLIKLLLENGADPTVCTERGTPIHMFVKSHSDETVLTLLIHRCTDFGVINSRDDQDYSPLDLAVIHRKFNLIPILLKNGADLYSKNKKGCMLFHTLIKLNYGSDIFEEVLKYHTGSQQINDLDNDGKSALHYAVWNYNIQMVRMLVNTAAINVDTVDGEGKKPAIIACEMGKMEMVKILLRLA
jgi:ankyrin repeat protein